MRLPIGLFDSGLGGLTVLKELKRRLPKESYLYLGDNARYPYGTKGEETICRYAKECAEFLLERKVKLIVVACNTASSVALESLKRHVQCPVIGTIDPAVREAIRVTQTGKICVLGTNATIASGRYEKSLRESSNIEEVVSIACPLFVPLVENGLVSGEIVEKIIELYLSPIKKTDVDTVILGCTHYPLLVDSLRKFLGDKVKLVECGAAIAKDVYEILGELNQFADSSPENHFFVTDEVGKFNHLANELLGGEKVEAIKVGF